MIRITSKIDGFRRAGVAHSAQPTSYPDDFFSAEQLALLEAEPNLIVQQFPDELKSGDDASEDDNSPARPTGKTAANKGAGK